MIATEAPVSPSASPRRSPWLFVALALAVLHFLWLWSHFSAATMSPDANGYVVQARLIATHGQTGFSTDSPAQFVGVHWLETTPGVFYSRYPAGLPLLFALAWKIGGLDAALLVNPVLASGTVLLVFLLARKFMSGGAAVVAAMVMALVPVANQHALSADSHTATGFLLVAGVFALLRFGENRSWRWGLLAGMLLGLVPTVRYPEALVGVAVAVWLLWNVRPLGKIWPAVLGAALPLGLLCAHNAAVYGAVWRTGYALTHEQTGFGFSYFAEHAVPYLQALSGQGLALFFALGVAGFAAMLGEPRERKVAALFLGIAAPMVVLYMAYYFGGAPAGAAGGAQAVVGNLRFLVPEFPFFAIAGAWLLAKLFEPSGRSGRIAWAAVVALQILIAGSASLDALKRTGQTIGSALTARKLAEKEIPSGSVLIVDRTLAESLDATGQWRLVDEALVAGGPGRMGPMAAQRMAGRRGNVSAREADPDAPSPQQAGKNVRQQERYAALTIPQRHARVWSDIITWAGDKPIYWFARSVDAVEAALPEGDAYEQIAEIDAPISPVGGGGSGLQSRGGGPGGPAAGRPGLNVGRGPNSNFGPPGMGAAPNAMESGPPNERTGTSPKLYLVRISSPKKSPP